MSLHVYADLEQREPEWHDARRGIVTASVVGRLITTRDRTAIEFACPDCGSVADMPCTSKTKTGTPIATLHPARTATARNDDSPPELVTARGDDAARLTLTLASERITGWTEEMYVSDAMIRGMQDEPVARDLYSEHWAPVVEAGFMVRDDWGYRIGYSPDGLVGDDGLIEIKSRAPKKHLQTILADAVPAENMAQIQCGLLVSGRQWCDYVSYCGGMPLWRKRVEPDERWFAAIVAAVAAFETTAAQMVATYHARTDGLPQTERIAAPEEITF